MKYIIFCLFSALTIACSESPNASVPNKAPVEVASELNTESQKLLDLLNQRILAGNDSLVVDGLQMVKKQLSDFINDSQLQNANDLRVAVQNYLDYSPEVAQRVKSSELVAAEVESMRLIPEIASESLPSFAVSLNDVGVMVEARTVQKLEEQMVENSNKEKLEENTNNPDQIVTEEPTEAPEGGDW